MRGEFLRGDERFARSLLARCAVKLEEASFCWEEYSKLFEIQGFHSERQESQMIIDILEGIAPRRG